MISDTLGESTEQREEFCWHSWEETLSHFHRCWIHLGVFPWEAKGGYRHTPYPLFTSCYEFVVSSGSVSSLFLYLSIAKVARAV
jgi:hypothetical protein